VVKFNTLNIILIVAIISLLYIVFFGEDEDYTQDYNVKIEALEQKVDSLHQTNASLKFEADSLGLRLESSDKKIKQLNTKIYVIKKETQKQLNAVNSFGNDELEQFFTKRYKQPNDSIN
jgi:peptidoglycan hydrolase CwlO-like protein|tara:strand:- start:80 stop:436 length:357 start_codon:yes stop_codon:yes gene_type:complete